MSTRIEHFRITPDGLVKVAHEYSTGILDNESVFFPDAIIDGRECCVQVSDEDSETFIEIFNGSPDEPQEIRLSFPNTSFDIPLGESQENGPSTVTRVTHLGNAVVPYENPFYTPN